MVSSIRSRSSSIASSIRSFKDSVLSKIGIKSARARASTRASEDSFEADAWYSQSQTIDCPSSIFDKAFSRRRKDSGLGSSIFSVLNGDTPETVGSAQSTYTLDEAVSQDPISKQVKSENLGFPSPSNQSDQSAGQYCSSTNLRPQSIRTPSAGSLDETRDRGRLYVRSPSPDWFRWSSDSSSSSTTISGDGEEGSEIGVSRRSYTTRSSADEVNKLPFYPRADRNTRRKANISTGINADGDRMPSLHRSSRTNTGLSFETNASHESGRRRKRGNSSSSIASWRDRLLGVPRFLESHITQVPRTKQIRSRNPDFLTPDEVSELPYTLQIGRRSMRRKLDFSNESNGESINPAENGDKRHHSYLDPMTYRVNPPTSTSRNLSDPPSSYSSGSYDPEYDRVFSGGRGRARSRMDSIWSVLNEDQDEEDSYTSSQGEDMGSKSTLRTHSNESFDLSNDKDEDADESVDQRRIPLHRSRTPSFMSTATTRLGRIRDHIEELCSRFTTSVSDSHHTQSTSSFLPKIDFNG
ncbi:uncharacterized protein I303_102104 [Kwoniella dejecticola CBS 10117]|uniref:Uncharacterized protein n=1 Tax=Kwoniella dejecticola CBS 10117 TaxID=1296121 RepID=A0A1A6ABV8_9TREE|nr:uncharacterized protein I303_01755 [Kwoniella dejecticola CBS 10117]OBR87547.1 hypothetical protein I303_01755 [Kwoniella dejecticola CBS 10117]